MRNFGQIALGAVLGVAVTSLAVIGYTYATNPQAQEQWGHVWAQMNENRHVCEVTGKHVETFPILGSSYYLHLDCGVDGSDDHELNPNYVDGNVDNATVYASVHVGEVYLTHIEYHKGHGDMVIGISPTTLSVGHQFKD